MSVPNNTTFNLQQVTTEIYGDTNSGRNLVDCFDDAALNKFDISYRGNLDSLLNFRNYGATQPAGNTTYILETGSSAENIPYINSSGGTTSITVPANDFDSICARTGSVSAPAGVAVTAQGSC